MIFIKYLNLVGHFVVVERGVNYLIKMKSVVFFDIPAYFIPAGDGEVLFIEEGMDLVIVIASQEIRRRRYIDVLALTFVIF